MSNPQVSSAEGSPGGERPICFVRVDQDYLLQLLQSKSPQPPPPQQPLWLDYKNAKQNGFQAALFLTPPKVNQGSSPSNFYVGHLQQPNSTQTHSSNDASSMLRQAHLHIDSGVRPNG